MDPEDPYSDADHFHNLNDFTPLPFQTYSKNFIKIRPYVFELSCIQTDLAAWIHMIQTVIQITPKS